MKMDDLMALISLGFVGQGVFILVGTTTFASILLFLANTLSFQEYLGTRVCRIINNLTGYTMSFKNAIVPRWRDTSIRLENVSIKCNKETWTELCLDQAAEKGQALNLEEIDTNFSYVDLTVDSIDVTLSLWRWLDGI